MSSDQIQERSFQVNGLNIAAKHWRSGAEHKVIALHGWLDNAGTFDLIAPNMPHCEIVALESAGHGRSDFRSADAHYLIWSEISEIFQVADQLNWENFSLIAHSRGAGIAMLCSGTFPERINNLVLIEGGIPQPLEGAQSPQNLADYIRQDAKLQGAPGTWFATREAAIAARADGFTKTTYEAAEILAIRSLKQTNNGFSWRADARLKGASAFRLTEDQSQGFLSRISAPTLLIEASNGIVSQFPHVVAYLEKIIDLKRVHLDGGHHLHLENAALDCAVEINRFLDQ